MIRIGLPLPYRGGPRLRRLRLGTHTLRDVCHPAQRYPHPPPGGRRIVSMARSRRSPWQRWRGGSRVAGRAMTTNCGGTAVAFCAVYVPLRARPRSRHRVFFDRYTIEHGLAAGDPAAALVWRYPPGRQRGPWPSPAMSGNCPSCGQPPRSISPDRARWEAYGFLRAHGVTLEQMDCGYRSNAFLAARPAALNLGSAGSRSWRPIHPGVQRGAGIRDNSNVRVRALVRIAARSGARAAAAMRGRSWVT